LSSKSDGHPKCFMPHKNPCSRYSMLSISPF
jgi:hypothetical protein